MTRTAVQVWLLATVLVRRWSRAELPGQVKRRGAGGRAVGAVLLRLLLLVLPVGLYSVGRSYAELEISVRAVAGVWAVGFLSLTVLAYGYIARAPQVRTERPALAEAFLDALPIERTALALAEMFIYVVYHVASGFLFAGLAPEGLRVPAFGVGMLFGMSVFFLGASVADLARAHFAPEALLGATRTLGTLVSLPMLALFLGSRVFLGSPPPWLLAPLRPLAPVVGGFMDGSAIPLPLLGAAVFFALGRWIEGHASRRGSDERSPIVTRLAALGAAVTPRSLDGVLESRERYRIALPAAVSVSIFTVVATSWVLASLPPEQLGTMAKGTVMVALVYVGFAVLSMNQGFALRAVSRDIVARPFLTTLPMEPRAQVRSREPWIARNGIIAALPVLALPVLVVHTSSFVEALWRTAALLVGIALAGFLAPSVAFLAASAFGADTAAARSGTLERVLLVFFGLGPAAAADPGGAALSLTLLTLLVVHARRSAEKCVRWIDDPDDFDREIPLWRALLAFGAFVTAQALFQALLGALTKDPALVVGLSFALAGAVLAALVFGGRRGLPELRWMPSSALAPVVGVAAGLAVAAAAVVYQRWLVSRGLLPEAPTFELGWTTAVLGVAVLVAAPLGEELFFRGWVQAAIHREYPRLGGPGAVLLGAFAFAAMHPSLAFPPVFTLGAVSGALYLRTGALLPSVLAHAAYNAVVLVLPLLLSSAR